MKPSYSILKNVIDRCAALALLALGAPVLLGAALAVKLSSRGPVLFWQDRIGHRGKAFRIFKFRTMHVHQAARAHASTTTSDDTRVSWVGKWLRRTKIDELPQLYNVLRGDMSLVGPRPTVREDYDKMTPRQRTRWNAKPGLTGLAQVRGGAALTWPKRIEFDLQYVESASLGLDLRVLWETALLLVTLRADTYPATADEWAESAGSASPTPALAKSDDRHNGAAPGDATRRAA